MSRGDGGPTATDEAITEATLDTCVDDALIAAQQVCNLPASNLTYVIENLESPDMPLKAQELLEAVGQMAGWLLRGEGPGDPGDAAAEERDVSMQQEVGRDGRTPLEILSQRCVTGADIASMLVPPSKRKPYSSTQLRIYTNALGKEKSASATEIAGLIPARASFAEKEGCRRAMVSLREWAVSLGQYFLTLEHLIEAEEKRNRKARGLDEEDGEYVPSWQARKAARKSAPPPRGPPPAAAGAASSPSAKAPNSNHPTDREKLQAQALENALIRLEACNHDLIECERQLAESNKSLHETRSELLKSKTSQREAENISKISQREAESTGQNSSRLKDDLASAHEGNDRLCSLLKQGEGNLEATTQELKQSRETALLAQEELVERQRQHSRDIEDMKIDCEAKMQQQSRYHDEELRALIKAERAKSDAEWRMTMREVETRSQNLEEENESLKADLRALRMSNRALTDRSKRLERENRVMEEASALGAGNWPDVPTGNMHSINNAPRAEAVQISPPRPNKATPSARAVALSEQGDDDDDDVPAARGGRKTLPSAGCKAARPAANRVMSPTRTTTSPMEEAKLPPKPKPEAAANASVGGVAGNWESGWTSRRTVKQVKEDRYSQNLEELKTEIPKKGYPSAIGGGKKVRATSPGIGAALPKAIDPASTTTHVDVTATTATIAAPINAASAADTSEQLQPKRPLKSSLRSRASGAGARMMAVRATAPPEEIVKEETNGDDEAEERADETSKSEEEEEEEEVFVAPKRNKATKPRSRVGEIGAEDSLGEEPPKPVAAGVAEQGWQKHCRDPRVEEFIRSLVGKPTSSVDLGEALPWLTNLDAVCDALIRYQRNSLVHLDIRACNKLSDASVPTLVHLIQEVQSLRNINFAPENFSHEAEAKLVAALAERTEQRVVQTTIDDISSGNVMCLSLKNKNLKDGSIQAIADAIEDLSDRHDEDPERAPHLVRTVDVRENDISDGAGAECLLRLLQLGRHPNKSGVVTVLAEGNPRMHATTLSTIQKLSSLRKQNYLVNGDPVGATTPRQ